MKLSDFEGYEIHLPTSGGKAGKGYAKTSNLQIRFNNCIVKQFQFTVADSESRKRAVRRAKDWVQQNPSTNRKEIE